MDWPEILTLAFNLFMCIPTLASLTKLDNWWVRGFDFPRVQISALIVVSIMLSLWVYSFQHDWHYVITGVLFICLIYQLIKIYPYTFIAPKQVVAYEGDDNKEHISILVSNVLTENRAYKRFIDLVQDRNPDMFLTLETDKKWENALAPLEKDYEYSAKIPLSNLYGMHLYSKLVLEDIEIKFLVKDDIPSIHGFVRLPNGKKVAIHCLHPRPPSPSESDSSTERDAELLLVAREINVDDGPVLVFGDFNDVAWSRTALLFQKISGLLDPRRGRGFFNTYNANYRLLRWPLDHVFHSKNFTLIELARCEHIGSDHFPMYIKLNYSEGAEEIQEAPEADKEDKEFADEKVEKASPKERSL